MPNGDRKDQRVHGADVGRELAAYRRKHPVAGRIEGRHYSPQSPFVGHPEVMATMSNPIFQAVLWQSPAALLPEKTPTPVRLAFDPLFAVLAGAMGIPMAVKGVRRMMPTAARFRELRDVRKLGFPRHQLDRKWVQDLTMGRDLNPVSRAYMLREGSPTIRRSLDELEIEQGSVRRMLRDADRDAWKEIGVDLPVEDWEFPPPSLRPTEPRLASIPSAPGGGGPGVGRVLPVMPEVDPETVAAMGPLRGLLKRAGMDEAYIEDWVNLLSAKEQQDLLRISVDRLKTTAYPGEYIKQALADAGYLRAKNMIASGFEGWLPLGKQLKVGLLGNLTGEELARLGEDMTRALSLVAKSPRMP